MTLGAHESSEVNHIFFSFMEERIRLQFKALKLLINFLFELCILSCLHYSTFKKQKDD